ncbi:MAG: anti-sigma regulatory factor [Parachlamydiaceae bacterium]|nr:anti-sigma regulatory factor [Parachlamydiaceae bacterium]
MVEKVFIANIEYLHEMLGFIKSFCIENGFDLNSMNKIALATEEALVNIIHHGYKNKKGTIEIICEKCTPQPGVKIVLKDKGVPFNPIEQVQKIKKNHKTPLEDSSIGGYGIFLYVEIMDEVEYKRIDDMNFLFLIKYLKNG